MIKNLFHPSIGATVHANEESQIANMRNKAPLMVIGLAAMPFTITLYRSKAIAVIVHIETVPYSEPPHA